MPKNAMGRARLLTALAFGLAAPGAWAAGAPPKKPKTPATPPAKAEGTPTCEQIIRDAGENARNILPCLIAKHPESRKAIARRLQSFLLAPRLTYRYAPASLKGQARIKTKAAVKKWTDGAAAQALSDLYIVAGWTSGKPAPAWIAESPKMKKDWNAWAYQRMKQKLETALIARWSEKVDGPEKAPRFLDDAAARAGKILDGPDGRNLRLKKPVGFGGSAPVDAAAVKAFQARVSDLARLWRGAHWGNSPQDVQIDGAVYAKVYSPKDKGYRWIAVKKGVQNGKFGYFVTDVTALLDAEGQPVAHPKEGASKPQFFKSATGEQALNLYPDSAKPIKYKLSFGGDGAVAIWREGDDAKRAGEGIFRTTTQEADAKWAGYAQTRGFCFLGAQLNFVLYQPDGTALFVPTDKVAGDPGKDFRVVDLAGADAQGNVALSGGDAGHLFYLHCAGGLCDPMPGKIPPPPTPASGAGSGGNGEGGGPNAGPNGGPNAGPNAGPSAGPGGGGPQSDGPGENHAQGLYSGDPVLNKYLQDIIDHGDGKGNSYFPMESVDSQLSGAFKKLVYVLQGALDPQTGLFPAFYAFRPLKGEPEAYRLGGRSWPIGHGDYVEIVDADDGYSSYYSGPDFLKFWRSRKGGARIQYWLSGVQASQMNSVDDVNIALIIMREYMGYKGDGAEIRSLVKEHAHGKLYHISGTKAAVVLATPDSKSSEPYELWPHPGKLKGPPAKAGKDEGKNGHPGEVAANGGDDTATQVTKDWIPTGQGNISCRAKRVLPSKTAGVFTAGVFLCGEYPKRNWYVAFQMVDAETTKQVVKSRLLNAYSDWPLKNPEQKLHVRSVAKVSLPVDFNLVEADRSNLTHGAWCLQRKLKIRTQASAEEWKTDGAGWLVSWGLTADQANKACETGSLE